MFLIVDSDIFFVDTRFSNISINKDCETTPFKSFFSLLEISWLV